jgi:hypothetical protein
MGRSQDDATVRQHPANHHLSPDQRDAAEHANPTGDLASHSTGETPTGPVKLLKKLKMKKQKSEGSQGTSSAAPDSMRGVKQEPDAGMCLSQQSNPAIN